MKKIAIIGAGISGLFIANLFKRSLNYQITVYEKSNQINIEKGYGIQLSVNSIKLLNEIEFDKFENDEKFTPDKINFYSKNITNKICELDISNFNTETSKYTTLKRSTLINFLKKDLGHLIKTGYSILKIDQQDQQIKLTFENNENYECDYLVISDGIFSKSKNLISNNRNFSRYNDTLAIRGVLPKTNDIIYNKNISLFLNSNFHHVIYPINSNGDLNFIAIMKYKLSSAEQKNYLLFSDNSFIKKVLDKFPFENKKLLNNLKELKIFPVFVSNNFYKSQNNKINLIGDAFFAFPPSFAQGASQSIESAYELFQSIENNTDNDYFKNRVNKVKMVNFRSKFNLFSFHLSNPINIFFRNILLKSLLKNKSFLEAYLGKIYKS